MIAITGAAGFIGSRLAHRLAALGEELLLVDHPLRPAKEGNLRGLKGFPLVEAEDFPGALEWGKWLADVVFHLGASTATTADDEPWLRQNHVEYPQRLWAWCARHGRPFFYASSAATYGDGSRGFCDRTAPGDLNPLNPYGRSKNEFDAWALAQPPRQAPPHWAGVKFFNVYGPGESHKGAAASVAWHLLRDAVQRGEITLFRSSDPAYPDGGQQRDFVFVEDCVEHLLWLWRARPAGGLYNSGTGVARTFADLGAAVFAALGKPPQVRWVPMPSGLADRYQHYTCADMSKLRQAGYTRPPTRVEEGIRLYLAALRRTGALVASV